MIHLLFALVSSVLQCGADPTGHKDSSAAFRSCLEQHPSGALFIPTGTYKIASTISLNRNQGLTGMGAKASVLKCLSPSSACLVIADTSGGGVSKATVELLNIAKGISVTRETDANGDYEITNVQPGEYAVTVSANGYETSKTDRFSVVVGARQRVDIQ